MSVHVYVAHVCLCVPMRVCAMNVHVWSMPARDSGAEGVVGYTFAKFIVCELVAVSLSVAV